MSSPRACTRPMFNACGVRRNGFSNTRTRGSRCARSARIAGESSVEPPSMNRNSSVPSNSWDSIACTASAKCCCSFSTGTSTLTSTSPIGMPRVTLLDVLSLEQRRVGPLLHQLVELQWIDLLVLHHQLACVGDQRIVYVQLARLVHLAERDRETTGLAV